MKKARSSAVALTMLFATSQAFSVGLFKNLTASGQIDLQATSGRNILDFSTRGNPGAFQSNNDRIGNAQTRLMLSIGADLLDDVHGMVTLRKNDRAYGDPGGSTLSNTNLNSQNISGSGANAGVLGVIFVDQAFFKIDKVGGAVDATFGRQFFGSSGDLITYFGPSDKAWYGLPTSSIDAARGDWSNDTVGVTALVGKIVGGSVGATASQDFDLHGLIVSLKGEGSVHGSVYLWNRLGHATGALGSSPGVGEPGGKNDNLYILGVKAKATMGNAWVNGEIARNFGENRNEVATIAVARYTGYALRADAGVKAEVGGVGAVTPWGEFGYGTGRRDMRSNQDSEFQSISSDYRPGAIYGRFGAGSVPSFNGLGDDISSGLAQRGLAQPGLANRVIVGAGVKVTPEALKKLTVAASVWDFRTQTVARLTPEGAQRPFGGNKHIGTEGDLEATWQHSENVTLMAGVGDFQPGGLVRALRNDNTTDHRVNPATLAFFDVRVKFGN